MRLPRNRDVLTKTDPDGRTVFGVPLSNSKERAWLYAEDYAELLKVHGPGRWRLNGACGCAYVRMSSPTQGGGNVMVARSIAAASRRTSIHYADGDRLNLRSSNLYASRGNGGSKQRKKVEEVAASVAPATPFQSIFVTL